MTPDRWQTINEIVHQALELDEPGRADFIEQACAGDDSLRDDVWRYSKAQLALKTDPFATDPGAAEPSPRQHRPHRDPSLRDHPGVDASRNSADPAHRETAQNLLFGLLALQNGFIGRKVLVATFGVWLADRARPLASLLLERGGLTRESYDLLQALVAQHLKQHGGAEASLASLSSVDSARNELQALGDPELDVSLGLVSADRESPRGDSEDTIDRSGDSEDTIDRSNAEP